MRPIYAALSFLGLFLAVSVPAPAQVESRQEGELVLENVPPASDSLRELMRPYQNVRSARFASWIPGSERMLVATRFAETSQLHVVDEPMAMRRQITFYDDPVDAASFGEAANPGYFLFPMDRDGSEKTQIYLRDLETSRTRMLTDGESVNRSAVWAHTLPRFAFSTTARNGRDWDIAIMTADTVTSGPVTVLEDSGLWHPMDWSIDDSALLVRKVVSSYESELFMLDLGTGERTAIGNRENGPVYYGEALFSRNGKGIFYISDEKSEFKRLHYYELEHGVSQVLTGELEFDVESMALSDDERFLAFTTNEEGYSGLYLLNVRTLLRERVELPRGIVSGIDFHPNSQWLGMTFYRPNAPGDAYVYDLAEKTLVRWTHSESGGLDEDDLSGAELIHYRTFDKAPDGNPRRVPAFVYKPRTKGPWPVIIDIHGGPEAQARPYLSSFFQFVVNEMNVAVIAPNVRGSDGYGKTYLSLDNGKLREDSVRDIGALIDWIAQHPEYDEKRVMVMGGSYGGYMTLASLAHYSDRLACGISLVGISNFVTFLESTSEYRRDLRREEYGDERDEEMRSFLNEISPTTNASKIRRPLFVVQGKNDPRVPYTEAEQIVAAVRSNDQPVWYMLALNEGHGLARKENRDAFRYAAAMFIHQYLVENPIQPPGQEVPEEAAATP